MTVATAFLFVFLSVLFILVFIAEKSAVLSGILRSASGKFYKHCRIFRKHCVSAVTLRTCVRVHYSIYMRPFSFSHTPSASLVPPP